MEMKMKDVNARQIAEIVASKTVCCRVVGVRVERFRRKRLGRVARSWNWPDGIRTSRLNGTCAIALAYNFDKDYDDIDDLTKKIQKNLDSYGKYISSYDGGYVVVVVGDDYEYGNDEWANEVVIKSCRAVGRLNYVAKKN